MPYLGHTQRVLGADEPPIRGLLCEVPKEVIEEVLQYLVAKALAGQHTQITALKLYVVDNMGPADVEAYLNMDKKKVIGIKQRVWEKLRPVKEILRWPVMGEIIRRSYQSLMSIDPIMMRDEPYPASLWRCDLCGAKVMTPVYHVIMKHRDLVKHIAENLALRITINCIMEEVSE